MILTDTNVLVYSIDTDSAFFENSRRFIEAIRSGYLESAVLMQNLLEFYAVVTNPRRVEHPLSPEIALTQINIFTTFLTVLDSGKNVIDLFQKNVIEYKVKGAEIFDTFLVAQMQFHDIRLLCTYNVKHFSKYEFIKAKTPEEILDSLEVFKAEGNALPFELPGNEQKHNKK